VGSRIRAQSHICALSDVLVRDRPLASRTSPISLISFHARASKKQKERGGDECKAGRNEKVVEVAGIPALGWSIRSLVTCRVTCNAQRHENQVLPKYPSGIRFIQSGG
jgi:hypothetical protein